MGRAVGIRDAGEADLQSIVQINNASIPGPPGSAIPTNSIGSSGTNSSWGIVVS